MYLGSIAVLIKDALGSIDHELMINELRGRYGLPTTSYCYNPGHNIQRHHVPQDSQWSYQANHQTGKGIIHTKWKMQLCSLYDHGAASILQPGRSRFCARIPARLGLHNPRIMSSTTLRNCHSTSCGGKTGDIKWRHWHSQSTVQGET